MLVIVLSPSTWILSYHHLLVASWPRGLNSTGSVLVNTVMNTLTQRLSASEGDLRSIEFFNIYQYFWYHEACFVFRRYCLNYFRNKLSVGLQDRRTELLATSLNKS
jgi:hypothetical protein